MNIKIFCHSLVSDWNHGNAHFLRGVASELIARGHALEVFEPRDNWSLANLLADRGPQAVFQFQDRYPQLKSSFYELDSLDLDRVLEGADLVLVHEWNDHELVRRIGEHRAENSDFHLLFHDTHHRSVTYDSEMAAYDLRHYDGVLAFGDVIRQVYLDNGWSKRAWTWHEAADTRVFHPIPGVKKTGDLVWVGNWGDEERTEELHEFLLDPVKALGLKTTIYGVRYPAKALEALKDAGITYGGSLANFEAPRVFAQHKATVHVPRRPYTKQLPGIPTIRVFEALACGIPLVSAPWNDAENLFNPGVDFKTARDGNDMKKTLRALIDDEQDRDRLAEHGLQTILRRHTCAHRVDELLGIVNGLKTEVSTEVAAR
jgi:spore maturation protein CgeB